MKSCLKACLTPGSPVPGSTSRKCVAFIADGSEEIHWADEWDRTPTEPAKKLSYQELLELKEIQQSLPHAEQPPDLRRPGKQLLSTVPITLMPLLAAETSSPVSPPPQSPESGKPYPTPFVMPPGRARPAPAPRLASPSLTHLRPLSAPAPRPKPTFSFVPLLSPSSSASGDDTTSYLSSYTPARSAADGEPDRVIISPPRPRPIPIAGTAGSGHPGAHGGYGGYEHAYRAAEAAAYSPPFGSSAYDYKRDRHDMLSRDRKASSSKTLPASPSTQKKKKKSFMMINDMEIEIEEDDDDEEDATAAAEAELDSLRLPMSAISLAAKPQPPSQSPPSPSSLAAKLPPPVSIKGAATTATANQVLTPTKAQSQTSPRLAARPLSPVSSSPTRARPVSPLATTMAAGAGRLSPVQARASSRLMRV